MPEMFVSARFQVSEEKKNYREECYDPHFL